METFIFKDTSVCPHIDHENTFLSHTCSFNVSTVFSSSCLDAAQLYKNTDSLSSLLIAVISSLGQKLLCSLFHTSELPTAPLGLTAEQLPAEKSTVSSCAPQKLLSVGWLLSGYCDAVFGSDVARLRVVMVFCQKRMCWSCWDVHS